MYIRPPPQSLPPLLLPHPIHIYIVYMPIYIYTYIRPSIYTHIYIYTYIRPFPPSLPPLLLPHPMPLAAHPPPR